jgi:UDP-glucose 4-epimerase
LKRILVTGGTGYICSHTVVELIQQGFEPVIIDNLSRSRIEVLDRIKEITGVKPAFHKVEMCDKAQMDTFFSSQPNFDAIIHFAGRLLVDESTQIPTDYYLNNIVSTCNLLDMMKKYNLSNLVFSSSCTVYGNPTQLPVNEEAPLQKPASPYGNTKKMCEEIIEDACKSYQYAATTLRYFNPIGAHKTALIGEEQHGVPTHLVPYITETAIGKRPVLRIFGDDYNTRDGSCVRDYIHVVDLAKAHVCAVKHMIEHAQKGKVEVFNLGSGQGQTVFEIVKAFEKATGLRVPFEVAPRRAGDVEAVYADNTKANRILKWFPELGIETMLQSAWAWEQKQQH